MNKRNYRREMEYIVEGLESVPTLLLHTCCAPCGSAVLEELSRYFQITVFYYNPNITEEAEYRHRISEVRRLIEEIPAENPISFLEGMYEPERFFSESRGLEREKEGGTRCEKCFGLRLGETAKEAAKGGFSFFTTTLTISPLKNADVLNEIGERMGLIYGVRFLPSDFKKKDGYKRSIELSKKYGLYRQDYCGCIYSKREKHENEL